MKPTWHLSSLVVLAGALHAQTVPASPEPSATAATAPATAPEPTTPAQQPSPASATEVGSQAPAPSQTPAATTTPAPSAPETAPTPAAPQPAPAAATPAAPIEATTPASTAPATTPVAKPAAPGTAAPVATPASSKPVAPVAKPATASSNPKPEASTTPSASPKPVAETPKSDKPSDAKSGESGGFAFQPGATFGTTTMNGQTWTRLSFTPEISFGKLGIGFNIELFLDQNQNLSSRGWDFDNARNGTESVLRKIDYVRWDHPGATFYARLGTLEGIQLGYGLVAANYGNKDRYPDYKELGAHVQLNDITGLGLDFETVVNSLQDIQNGGPFTAFRAGIRPFKPMSIPLFQKLAVRAGVAYDWNQYAGLRDQDGDGCPDVVDAAPSSGRTCVELTDITNVPGLDTSKSTGYNIRRRDSFDIRRSDDVRDLYSMRKPFGIFWAEAALPVFESKIFGLDLHSAFAKPETQDENAADAGWGAIPLGASSHLGPITLTAEYRAFSQPFQPDYFNSMYGSDRAKFIGGEVVTKELDVYGKEKVQTGMMQGYFASAGWDVFGFLKLQGSYSDLFPSKSGDDELRSASASAGIGPQVTSLLQQKVSLAEVYWSKDRIGLDRWETTEGTFRDGFFGRSIYTVYGYRVGSQVAPGLTLIVDRQTSYSRDANGDLVKKNQMRIESQMKF